ncbi:MAG: heme-copper oxidase subunit III [Bacteriovoracaceae bacterium]|nr:heme-copper oxidase subunit III [Bacteriovoracaceae bacterium]
MTTGTNEILIAEKERADLAMTVTLVSFAMLFATLFLMYAVFRSANPVWPPMGFAKTSLLLPNLSLAIIFFSSLFLHTTQRMYQLGNSRKVSYFYYLTLIFALAFVGIQFLIWKQLKLDGIYLDSGIFASIIYGFTWIHCAHVVMGFLGLLYCFPMIRAKYANHNFSIRLSNVAKFWHFLGIIWFLMILFIFVL